MPKEIEESLKERVRLCDRFLADLKDRNDIAPLVVEIRERSYTELELFEELPESIKPQANERLGPVYELTTTAAGQELPPTGGPLGPTPLMDTISGATGGTLETLDLAQQMNEEGDEQQKGWSEKYYRVMAHHDFTSTLPQHILNIFSRVDNVLAGRFGRALDAWKRYQASVEPHHHLGNDYRVALDGMRDHLVRRLKKNRPQFQSKKWADIERELWEYRGEFIAVRSLNGRLSSFYDRVSKLLKEMAVAPSISEADRDFATFIELCHAAALFFVGFDALYGAP